MIGKNNTPIIVGIAGPSGSGKSLLARTLVNELGSTEVAVISEDFYYQDLGNMPQAVRAKLNFDHPEALDHELLVSHLKRLQNGERVEIPQYDHRTHSRLPKTLSLGQHSLYLIEGILLFTNPALRALMDIRLYVDTPLDICFIRRLERDVKQRGRTVDSVIAQYQSTVRPMYVQFIEPSKHHADLIVPRGGKNRIAIDVIKARMEASLASSQWSTDIAQYA